MPSVRGEDPRPDEMITAYPLKLRFVTPLPAMEPGRSLVCLQGSGYATKISGSIPVAAISLRGVRAQMFWGAYEGAETRRSVAS
jgi:hypothetical protein